jgi:hypothetical protein
MDDLSEKDDTGCVELLAAALVVFIVAVGGAVGVYEFIQWAAANPPRGW